MGAWPMTVQVIAAKQPTIRSVGRKLACLVGDHLYLFKVGDKIYQLKIRDGYLFDGASVPWYCWTLLRLAPHGIMDGPALPHDLIYETRGVLNSGTLKEFDSEAKKFVNSPDIIAKGVADELLRSLCLYFNACGPARARLVWSAVASFGWMAWLRDDRNRKAKVLSKLSEEVL